MARILVIDDDNDVRAMIGQTLEHAGYTVVLACDGNEGIKSFRADPTDIIITDIIMPEKEGIETIIELRRDFPDVKIIAISGGGRGGAGGYLSMAEKLGAQRSFAKPFSRVELLDAIKELLET